MASKLDPHKDLIFQSLLEGMTYKSIVHSLSQRGCDTSLTNLNDWAKRRARKLISRANIFSPSASTQVKSIRPVRVKEKSPATYLDLYL